MTGHPADAGGATPGSGESDPVFRVGGLSYLHIPAIDEERSSVFYRDVFGWRIRGGPGHRSFDDGSGHVIGAWVTNRTAAAPESGFVPFIYVESVDDTAARVATAGGSVTKEPYPEGDLWVATFRDPAGNAVGAWQRGPRNAAKP